MSSAGQIVGGVVGAVIGFYAGGPYGAVQGAMIGAGVGTFVDPPKGPNMQGPRLQDLSVQTSTYGASIGMVEGTCAVTGNVIWVEGDKLKETSRKSDSGGKGGGSTATETYTYSATFAVGLVRGPIAGVRRIWIGSDLIYDPGSDDLASIIASNKAAHGFTIYLGTDTQQPDPRMQADKGVANTPAYRGLAYIVFYDLDLTNYGNTLMGAQVKVEVNNSDGSPAGWLFPNAYQLQCLNYSEYAGTYWQDQFIIMQREPASIMVSTGWPTANSWRRLYLPETIYDRYGYFYGHYFIPAGNSLYCVTPGRPNYGVSVHVTGNLSDWKKIYTAIGNVPGSPYAGPLYGKGCYDDGSLYFMRNVGTYADGSLIKDIAKFDAIKAEKGIYPWTSMCSVPQWTDAFTIVEGRIFLAVIDRTTTPVRHKIAYSDDFSAFTYIPGAVATNDPNFSQFIVSGNYVWFSNSYYQNTWCIRIDPESLNVTSHPVPSLFEGFDHLIDIEGQPGSVCANSVNSTGYYYPVIYNDKASPQSVSLSSIVKKFALSSGLIADADINTTALTDSVRGYRTTGSGSISSDIEPLRAAWPFDLIQRGYGIVAKPRGGASVATIPAELLDAREISSPPGAQLLKTREMASQLPRRLTLKYLDTDREYDTSEQSYERENTAAINEKSLDLTVVLTATEAARKVEVLLYLYWMERTDVQITLPPAYLHLEAGDVITVTTSTASYELRIVEATYTADCRVECKCKYNSAAVYVSTAVADGGTVQGRPLALTGPCMALPMDVPCVSETSLDKPAVLVAMTGYTSAWPGGVLYKSSDTGQTWSEAAFWSAPCTMGSARNAIAAQQTAFIDTASVLQVDLLAGSLESVTELAMLNGANHFAYGADGRWEIIAAKNAVLQADGSYLLSDLLRGRAGTEWAVGTHLAGDHVVLLTDPDVAVLGMDSVAIGAARQYKAITLRHDLAEDSGLTHTYRGVNLKPLSPVYANGQRNASSGDWALSWIRRTRVGGEWRDSVDALLGETSERYEVDVCTSDFATVKRTLSSIGAAVMYYGTNQVTDFGANQTTLYLKIYQISATVGRGYPLQVTLTRTA